MKLHRQNIFLATATFISIVACSRKSNTIISRNFHAVATEFNTLYNGQVAYDQGVDALTNGYADDFWNILPIEPIEITDEIKVGNTSQNSNFQRAEEKATKAIQRHSMLIDGIERNPQIDEAFLLLGKSRYHDQRFIPALDAFNYILDKYPTSDKINTAKIWREKTNMRLDNSDITINNLKRLLKYGVLKPQDLADATAVLAQAYLYQKHKDSAITQLQIAAQNTKNKTEKGRYNYILGQLYNSIDKKDSAIYAFDQVIKLNRKIPRIYLINAKLEKISNIEGKVSSEQLLEAFDKLENNRENRPFLNRIYHQKGVYYLNTKSDSLAELYFKASLKKGAADQTLLSKNYQALGDLKFNNTDYINASAYYDSTITQLKENTKLYRAIKKKRQNLDDVIYYEAIANRNDSILKLTTLSPEKQVAYFKTFTDKLKAAAEKAAAEAENNEDTGAFTSGNSFSDQTTTSKSNTTNGTFYFYNQETIAFGKNEFKKQWGKRALEDNWRLSSKIEISKDNTSNKTDEQSTVSTDSIANTKKINELFDPQFYVSKIPTKQSSIDSIAKERDFSYYQLGLIYSGKFKEYNLAKNKLEKLLKHQPEQRLILPIKYNLYKIYTQLNDVKNITAIKNDIVTNYPESRYAAILLNPNKALVDDESSPENSYNKVYKAFENQEYSKVLNELKNYISVFDGDPIIPKFELLKAVTKGRLYGFKAYKESVSFVALNYPSSEEGKRAEEMLTRVFPEISDSIFKPNNEGKNFKTIFKFDAKLKEDINVFAEQLNRVLPQIDNFKLKQSIDVYDENIVFVTIHGFKTLHSASEFLQLVNEFNEAQKEKKDKVNFTRPHFSISSRNYQTIQIHKNLEAYLNQLNN